MMGVKGPAPAVVFDFSMCPVLVSMMEHSSSSRFSVPPGRRAGQTLAPSHPHFHPLPRDYIHRISTLKPAG